jgi:hypothetical protein
MDRERQQFRDYLLGVLPEPEAAALDEQLFRSDDALNRLEDEQQILMDDSARGLLSAEEEARFRVQCSRSPQLSRDAAEVKALIAGLSRRRPATRLAMLAPLWQRFFLILSPALAAALCVAVFLDLHERRENVILRTQSYKQAETSGPTQPAAGGQTFTAFLAANVVRGVTSLPRIVAPANASAVELQVEVRGGSADSGAWTVNLFEGSHPIWTSTRVPLRRVGGETFLDVQLNADVLTPGTYELQLTSPADPRNVQTRQFVVATGR